jgi:cytoskeletal protein RodZ
VAVFNNTTSELPESQIEYHDNGGGRRIITLLIYVVLALAVAALVVFAGRWIYHKVSNNDSNPAPTTISTPSTSQKSTSSPPTASPTPTSKAPTTYTSPQPTTPPSSSTKSKPSTTSPTASTPTPTTLPNNGPGEIIALFIGTSFVAAFLHFTIKLRNVAKNV